MTQFSFWISLGIYSPREPMWESKSKEETQGLGIKINDEMVDNQKKEWKDATLRIAEKVFVTLPANSLSDWVLKQRINKSDMAYSFFNNLRTLGFYENSFWFFWFISNQRLRYSDFLSKSLQLSLILKELLTCFKLTYTTSFNQHYIIHFSCLIEIISNQ